MRRIPRYDTDRHGKPAAPAGPCWGWFVECDGHVVAWIVCGNQHETAIEQDEVSSTGMVLSASVCPEPGCPWHTDVVLEGWERRTR